VRRDVVVVGDTVVVVVDEIDGEVGGRVLIVLVEVPEGSVVAVPTWSTGEQLMTRMTTRRAGIRRVMAPQRVERLLGSFERSTNLGGVGTGCTRFTNPHFSRGKRACGLVLGAA
jgi:hypothetical protein